MNGPIRMPRTTPTHTSGLTHLAHHLAQCRDRAATRQTSRSTSYATRLATTSSAPAASSAAAGWVVVRPTAYIPAALVDFLGDTYHPYKWSGRPPAARSAPTPA